MKLKRPLLLMIAVGFVILVGLFLWLFKPFKFSSATAFNDSWSTQVATGVEGTMQAVNEPTITNAPTATTLPPTVTPFPPTATPFIVPTEHYIQGFKGHSQYYSLGCEASAAVDLAEYFDIHFYQFDFQFDLPVSDNPDLGFVGDVNGPWGQIPPYAYGVHAGPVADLLNEYGLPVEGGKGYTLEQIKRTLAQNKPVIVWVIGRMEYSQPVEYTDKAGNKTIVARYEHVVILTGYNEDTVRFVSNGYWYDIENETFLNSWGVLGNMAVLPK